MDVNKCAECDFRSTTYCDRCQDYFCHIHGITHLQAKICTKCNQLKCDEMMHTDELCFVCWARYQFAKINSQIDHLNM